MSTDGGNMMVQSDVMKIAWMYEESGGMSCVCGYCEMQQIQGNR